MLWLVAFLLSGKLSEKYLEAYNDVFADILNVLLFHGKEQIKPSELSEIITETQYKADGKPHEQRRKNKHYVPPKGVIQHVDALLQMMTALTHDRRFEQASAEWEGEEKVMSELFLDQIEERGERKNLISLICKKIVKGKIPEIIADELEEEEAVIREIYDIALAFAPDYDCNAIYEAWKVKQE